MGGRKEECNGGEINSLYKYVFVIVFKTGISVFCKGAEKSQEYPSKTSCFLPNESSGSHLGTSWHIPVTELSADGPEQQTAHTWGHGRMALTRHWEETARSPVTPLPHTHFV